MSDGEAPWVMQKSPDEQSEAQYSTLHHSWNMREGVFVRAILLPAQD